MKKILFTGGLLLFVCYGMAQGGLSFGVRGGIGLGPVYNETWMNDVQLEYLPTLAWSAGVSVGWNAAYYNFGVTVGGFYKTYGQRLEYKLNNHNRVAVDIFNIAYFDVPVLMRLRPSGDKVTKQITYGGPYFEIGVQPSFLLSASHSQAHPDLPPERILEESEFEDFNVAAVVGFGIHHIGTDKWSVTHGLRLSYHFLDVFVEEETANAVLMDRQYENAGKTTLPALHYVLSIIHKRPETGRY